MAKVKTPPVPPAQDADKAPAGASTAVQAAPKKPKLAPPVKVPTVRFISVIPGYRLIINPDYTVSEEKNGRTRTQKKRGDAVQFSDNYADVPEELVEDARRLPNYRVKYIELEELQRMQDSDDPAERDDAERFLRLADKHRVIVNKPRLTKQVLAAV